MISIDDNVFSKSAYCDYGAIVADGFAIKNIDRSDDAFFSSDSNFDAVNGDFYDGPGVLEVPIAQNSETPSRIDIQRQNGSAFSIESIELDTPFAVSVPESATFTGTTASGGTVTQTFLLDNVQGFQTFQFSTQFADLTSLQLSSNTNLLFDDITLSAPVPDTPTGLALSPTSDTGVKGDDITAASTPEIDGAGDAGDSVRLLDGAKLVGTGTVAADNSWSVTTTTLGSGNRSLTAIETDAAGNTSNVSAPLTLIIDTTAPTIASDNPLSLAAGTTQLIATSLVSASDNVSSGAQLIFTVTTPPSGGTLLVNSVSTSTFTEADLAAGHVSYKANAGGAAADHFSFTIKDAAGNATQVQQFQINVAAPTAYPSPPQPVHPNDLSHSSTASGSNHFIDLLNFEASYRDLIAAFGTNQAAMQNWYNQYEPLEHRTETFDGLDYIASYHDLINAFGGAGFVKAVQDDGASHFIAYGHNEGRATTFNGLDYIASYKDLIKAFGSDNDAGAYHYIEHGSSEGRTVTFDGLDYIASYSDLIKAFGDNEQAGASHFITYGSNEGRTTTFDGLSYIAGYTDLMNAFGADNDVGAAHYIDHGLSEGRHTAFNVAGYESTHPDLIGKFTSNDAFLTAYIDTYRSTGTFLT